MSPTDCLTAKCACHQGLGTERVISHDRVFEIRCLDGRLHVAREEKRPNESDPRSSPRTPNGPAKVPMIEKVADISYGDASPRTGDASPCGRDETDHIEATRNPEPKAHDPRAATAVPATRPITSTRRRVTPSRRRVAQDPSRRDLYGEG